MSKTRKLFDRSFKLKAVELSYQRENIKELALQIVKYGDLKDRLAVSEIEKPQVKNLLFIN